LITHLQEFDRCIAIAGFKNVRVEDVTSLLNLLRAKAGGVEVQLFDASVIAGHEHLFFAALNALNAFRTGINISKSLAVEALLYASAQRQIRRAVERLGVKPGLSDVALLLIAPSREEAAEALRSLSRLIPGERSDEVLELTREKLEKIRELFGISSLELKAQLRGRMDEGRAVTELVIEHMALLATQR